MNDAQQLHCTESLYRQPDPAPLDLAIATRLYGWRLVEHEEASEIWKCYATDEAGTLVNHKVASDFYPSCDIAQAWEVLADTLEKLGRGAACKMHIYRDGTIGVSIYRMIGMRDIGLCDIEEDDDQPRAIITACLAALEAAEEDTRKFRHGATL